MSRSITEMADAVKELVDQGIDCTEWAMSHGVALTNTPTWRNGGAYFVAKRRRREEAELATRAEAERCALTVAGQMHAPHEYNNGKTDKQRLALAAQWVANQPVKIMTNNITTSGTTTNGATTSFVTIPGSGLVTSNGFVYPFQQHPYVVPSQLTPISQEPPVVITGKQYVIVCNGRVEYEDAKDKAQAAAERLAHANQQDAFILKPVSRTAPKRDVVTTEIKL